MARAVVRLTVACNNRCVFCAQAGLTAPAEAATIEAQLIAARAHSTEVTFVGGEPTLLEELTAAVAQARAAGFARVGLQTNARLLAGPDPVRALAAAGVTDLQVSIHGSDAAVHDYHTGVEGSLDETLAGVAHARAYGLTVVAVTVLTRSNFRVLAGLPLLLKSRGVAAWLVEVPHAAGRAGDAFDRVVPRLGLAIPFALHALQAATALSLPAWIRGVPLCLTGPLAARVLPSMPRAYGAA
ncbi:MAG: radical domain protein, partial [bacterium]|nr:radical domain protein [bacterium]